MVKKFLNSNQLNLFFEDVEDILKCTPLFYDCVLTIKRHYHLKDTTRVKRKQRTVLKTIVLTQLVPFLKDTNDLTVIGKWKGINRKLHLKVLDQVIIEKDFNDSELAYIENLESKKTSYIGVDTDKIHLGFIVGNRFVESKCHYIAKEKSLIREVLLLLKQIDRGKSYMLKAPGVFVKQLKELTGLEWQAIKNDTMVDWEEYRPNTKKENLLIDTYLNHKKKTSRDLKESIDAILSENFQKIFLTHKAPLDLFNLICPKKENLLKTIFLDQTDQIEPFTPQGFLLVRYF